MNLKIFSDGQHMKLSPKAVVSIKGSRCYVENVLLHPQSLSSRTVQTYFFPGYPQMTLASYAYVS